MPSPRRYSEARLTRYVDHGLHGVQGWLDDFSAAVIARLGDSQSDHGVAGAVAEIGVHHGKLFLVLQLTLRQDEQGLAIDLFEQQELNVDLSGQGDRGRFLENLRKHCGTEEGVVIRAGSSTDVTVGDIRATVGPVRLFSVDGGHTEMLTANDLGLAAGALAEGGIVILDDHFNPYWPDVAAGLGRHILVDQSPLRPFAITPGKVFLCAPEWSETWRDALIKAFPTAHEKHSEMYGAPVEILGLGRFSLRSEADRHVSQLKAYVKTRPALAAFARKVTGREK
ncbi:class I SAM-dependent methyltransferase [Tistrella sp. BH-R2-4]|uniref:Class I SAM-dependent methyltransferase n=1 Tax=Tistrella arctica TaxID=3133430 RepID=A0ABU9YS57_9PROT